MSEPRIAGRRPVPADVQAGETKAWCACGRSEGQPFCDGAHQGTDFTPVVFKAEEAGQVFLCMCKMTKNAPYCDGTHATLGEA